MKCLCTRNSVTWAGGARDKKKWGRVWADGRVAGRGCVKSATPALGAQPLRACPLPACRPSACCLRRALLSLLAEADQDPRPPARPPWPHPPTCSNPKHPCPARPGLWWAAPACPPPLLAAADHAPFLQLGGPHWPSTHLDSAGMHQSTSRASASKPRPPAWPPPHAWGGACPLGAKL